MQKHLHLGVILAVLLLSIPVLALAEVKSASYILVRDISAGDRPGPILIITADQEIAASFQVNLLLSKDPLVFRTDLPDELVRLLVPSMRLHVLDDKMFDRIDAFIAQQSKELKEPERVNGEYGTLEVERRSKDHKPNGYYFVTLKPDSRAFLQKLLDYLVAQKLSVKLQGDVRGLLTRLD